LTAVDAERTTRAALEPLADDLRTQGPIRLVAAGKAAIGMARAVSAVLGGQLTRAVVTAAAEIDDPRWTCVNAGHPVPDAGSEQAGRAALDLADAAAREGGLLLVCLSGGASAMLAVPAEGVSSADKFAATQALLASGMDIGEMNLVRRHLSAIKGGQLAARAGRSVTLAISDVCRPVDDDPRVLGSGPTAGDDSSRREALEAIARHGLAAAMPAAVLAHDRRLQRER
jgi:hydroxypyruvate reductase